MLLSVKNVDLLQLSLLRMEEQTLFKKCFQIVTRVEAAEMNYCSLWQLVSAKLITGALVRKGRGVPI